MKKVKLNVMLAIMFMFVASNVFAQPFTPDIANDVYGILQGGGNLPGVSTPNDDNDNLAGVPNPADINDAINLLLGTAHTHNSDVDNLQFTGPDSTWQDLSDQNNDGTFILISLTAANSNSLRVYSTAAPGVKIPVVGLTGQSGFGFTGDGTSAATPFTAGLSPLAPGTNFGWSIESVPTAGPIDVWDSNPALNPDGLDHMLTYRLSALAGQEVWVQIGAAPAFLYEFKDPYLIAWEDKPVNLQTGKLGDEDYDDLIYLVDRVQPIPEPMTMALFGSGLVGFAMTRRKKRS